MPPAPARPFARSSSGTAGRPQGGDSRADSRFPPRPIENRLVGESGGHRIGGSVFGRDRVTPVDRAPPDLPRQGPGGRRAPPVNGLRHRSEADGSQGATRPPGRPPALPPRSGPRTPPRPSPGSPVTRSAARCRSGPVRLPMRRPPAARRHRAPERSRADRPEDPPAREDPAPGRARRWRDGFGADR